MYSPEDRARICAEVADRISMGEYLEDICARDGMPNRATILRWQMADGDFAAQCARARRISAEINERRVASLADGVVLGTTPPDAARVAINAYTWLAKVRDPQGYGDKAQVEHSGRDGGPIEHSLVVEFVGGDGGGE